MKEDIPRARNSRVYLKLVLEAVEDGKVVAQFSQSSQNSEYTKHSVLWSTTTRDSGESIGISSQTNIVVTSGLDLHELDWYHDVKEGYAVERFQVYIAIGEYPKYLADTNLHVHLEEIKVDKTLRFVEEPVEIIDYEVKSLKRSRIPIVKSIGTRSEVMRIS
ncbi:hypothetical protein Tco_0499918 [Tanacetum coccineum]